MSELLFADWSPWAIATKLSWLLQLALIIHVLRTGRPYWWIFILFMAPLLGGVAYLFVEVLPDLQGPPGRGGPGLFARMKPRGLRVRELRAALEESDTVKTRLTLARELLAADQPEEAHATALPALQGVFRDDPHTLTEVARIAVATGRFDEALALLDRVDVTADRLLDQQVSLLKGRALAGTGRPAEAEDYLRALQGRLVGDEAPFHLAGVLAAAGRREEAIQIWREITRRFRRAGPAWRRSEKIWYRQARARLREFDQR